VRGLIRALIDTYELSFVTFPFRVIMSWLCNSAGQAVLGQTVASVETSDKMENLIARLWSAEMGARNVKQPLLAAINAMPPALLLRYALYNHLIARVFWSQWEIENQLVLLDAADECFAPIDTKRIDKGRLQRRVSAAKRDKKGS
jgi:hypothetical protein